MRIGCGILAVWNDCLAGEEAGYERWYLGEHLPERVGIPGFVWGRRYRRLAGGPADLPEYMTYYETDTPEVLTAEAYLARVNAPTPETHRIMTGVFLNMSRTLCRRVAGSGAIRTGYTVAAVSDRELALQEVPSADPPTLWREAWESAEPADHQTSEEERLRGGDAKISACLLVDVPTEADALALAGAVSARGDLRVAAFRFTGSLSRKDL